MQYPEPDDGAWPARVLRNRRMNQIPETENPATPLRFMHQRLVALLRLRSSTIPAQTDNENTQAAGFADQPTHRAPTVTGGPNRWIAASYSEAALPPLHHRYEWREAA